MNTQTRLKLLIIAVVAGLLILIAYLLLKPGQQLELESTSPVLYDQQAPQDSEIEFYFNKTLSKNQRNDMQIKIAPSIEFETIIEGNTIRLNYDKPLIDETTYNISITNLSADDGTLLELASNTFTVRDNSIRGEFLRQLPFQGDGFTIVRLSTDTIYAQITKSPVSEKSDSVYSILAENNITNADFVIRVEALRSLTGAGAPAEPSQPLPAGE